MKITTNNLTKNFFVFCTPCPTMKEVGNFGNHGRNTATFEYYNFFRWESFIGTVAILLHYEKYAEIYKVFLFSSVIVRKRKVAHFK